jgi:hypothetical protein
MKKQKKKLVFFIFISVLAGFAFASRVFAYGGATVSWTAPTTDEGGGSLGGGTSDLSGYRVYYSTSAISCTSWNAASQTNRKANTGSMLPSTYATVSEGTTISYAFGGTTLLTPGSTYNFAVTAYDTTGNLSQCATTSGSATYVSKAVTYAADTDNSSKVDYLDYGTFHNNYHTSNAAADFDKSGYVDYLDYNILHNDYNQCFGAGC